MQWPISWSDVKDHIDDIEDGIDPKLLPQGGVGYTEPGKVITWDGDTTGLEAKYIASGRLGYKVSNDAVDLTKLTKITDIDGELTPDRYSFDQYDNIQQILDVGGYPIICAYMDVPNPDGSIDKGVFFYRGIRSIETAETIHPIDPKFLPNVFAPNVIDMTALGVTKNMLFSGTEIPVGEQLTDIGVNAAKNMEPVNIVFHFGEHGINRIQMNYVGTDDTGTSHHFMGFGDLGYSDRFMCMVIFNAVKQTVLGDYLG